jgi:S1-C subfamily serine protease
MPINRAKSMLDEFQQRGHISRPTLGVRTVYVAGDLAGMLDLPSQGGLLIQSVERGSAAEGAGLRGPSKMVIVGGFQLGIGGDLMSLTVSRSGRREKIQVHLGEAPQQF